MAAFSVTDGSLAGLVTTANGGNGLPGAETITATPNGTETDFGMPRSSFYGPGYFDIDTSTFENFSIKERLLNHPNFANPSGNISAPGLGLIGSTVSAPTSPYGAFQGSAVSGRVATLTGRFTF